MRSEEKRLRSAPFYTTLFATDKKIISHESKKIPRQGAENQ